MFGEAVADELPLAHTPGGGLIGARFVRNDGRRRRLVERRRRREERCATHPIGLHLGLVGGSGHRVPPWKRIRGSTHSSSRSLTKVPSTLSTLSNMSSEPARYISCVRR